ncbi:MAG TPA: B12-binding domain-containing protein [Streptosporangiaceae bacterium]|nr:B12-binding domain-containing protein [Streptosporangiaceae bacterium]
MRLHEAAEILGVHYQTAYGWVREGKLPARMVAGGYDLTEADVQAFKAQRQLGRESASQIQVRDWAAQVGRLYRAIANGEETQARRAMDRLAGAISMTDLCDRVIAPALRQIGDAWQTGAVSIAQEHRATAICERIIAAYSSRPAGRPRGVAVAATPAGERHAMPSLMAAAALRENHWRVHHLGADLPAAEIATLAADSGASLVVLSTATAYGVTSALQARKLIERIVLGVTVLTGRSGETLAGLAAASRSPAS